MEQTMRLFVFRQLTYAFIRTLCLVDLVLTGKQGQHSAIAQNVSV